MKSTLLAAVAIFLCTLSSFAQNLFSIKGSTVDTASKVKLTTTITVLNAKDSILNKFTHAAEDGSFSIGDLSAGKYLLLITYPDYADYVETFTMDDTHKEHDFGKIYMTLKSRLLKEVLIKGEVRAIKIKGDTTEFNAKAYVIQPNDKVEDLLKQLPGIQVDKDGKITAQGEKVNKVLVDGEEFFGDDPTLVTRNLRSDMVDKVLLYDKKSDQAAFTGIDDGVKNKTLDIRLKEDKKTGIFGKVDGGIGTHDYYEGQALFNKFKAKSKFSAYATAANDGKTGLGYQDVSKLGTSSSNVQISDDGGTIISFGGGDPLDNGTYYGRGAPLARSGGVHYDDKWDNDKESINTNYKIGSIAITTDQNTISQQTLPGSVFNRENTQNSYTYVFRQKLDATYQKTLDATSNLKVSVDGTIKNNESRSNSIGTTEDGNGNLLNRQTQSNNDKGQTKVFNASVFYTKKFKKTGRTLSWDVNGSYNQNQSTGFINSDIYTPANSADSILNQYRPTTLTSTILNSNITYSEPLSKKFAVIFNYGLGLNNSISDKESFNQSSSGKYDILDPDYSNDYKFNQLTNQLGAIFNYKSGKTLLNFGTKASAVNFEQIDEFTGNIYKRNFINWAPQARFQYRMSTAKSLNINYNGNTSQPTIEQIQPVKNNNDPLNIFLGNPDLKPSFTHRFNLSYNSFHELTNQYFFANGSYSLTTNTIVNNTATDANAKSTTQYVNLTNKTPYNYYLYVSTSRKISAWDMNINLSLSTNDNVTYNYINNDLNRSNSRSYSASIGFNKNAQKKYNFYASGGPSYNYSEFSLQPQVNNNAAGWYSYGSATVFLPWKFQLSSDANYNYKAKTQAFGAQNITMWNAAISKTFLKEDKLKLSLSGNNLLNQDQNNRSTYGGTVTQTSYNTIKRYLMLTLTWDFTKFGTTPSKN